MNLGKLFGASYPKINVHEAARLADDGAVLLDVRDPHEWQAGHAPNARHLPLAELSRRLDEIPANKPILTICRSGHRSGRAAAILADAGRDVSNVAGGMSAWSRAGLPVVAKGGAPGRIA